MTSKVDLPENSFQSLHEDTHENRHAKLTETIVYIHNSVRTLNKKLRKNAKKFNYITPRDYLDFIKQFVSLQQEKKTQLEEQQFHINSGLQKLQVTEEQVMKMKKELNIKKIQLKKSDKEAKEKLNLMVSEKNKAEKEKEASEKLNAELAVKQQEIAERSKGAEEEL